MNYQKDQEIDCPVCPDGQKVKVVKKWGERSSTRRVRFRYVPKTTEKVIGVLCSDCGVMFYHNDD